MNSIAPHCPWPFGGLRPLSFRVVLADPPWKFEVWSGDKTRVLKGNRSAERHYDTMTFDEIAALPVGHLLRGDGVLFLWILDTHLEQSLELIRRWGLRFKKVGFIWVKETKNGAPYMSTGYWTRGGAEVCLMATTGAPTRLDKGVAQVLHAIPTEHSRKPEEVADRIERLVPGPYCELFARRRRPGWTCWGREVGKFDEKNLEGQSQAAG